LKVVHRIGCGILVALQLGFLALLADLQADVQPIAPDDSAQHLKTSPQEWLKEILILLSF
jgi:hypothetical protein